MRVILIALFLSLAAHTSFAQATADGESNLARFYALHAENETRLNPGSDPASWQIEVNGVIVRRTVQADGEERYSAFDVSGLPSVTETLTWVLLSDYYARNCPNGLTEEEADSISASLQAAENYLAENLFPPVAVEVVREDLRAGLAEQVAALGTVGDLCAAMAMVETQVAAIVEQNRLALSVPRLPIPSGSP